MEAPSVMPCSIVVQPCKLAFMGVQWALGQLHLPRWLVSLVLAPAEDSRKGVAGFAIIVERHSSLGSLSLSAGQGVLQGLGCKINEGASGKTF